MRLNQFQIETINKLARSIFGYQTVVSLFGSRTDNNKKGGDIDLLISNKNTASLTTEAKVRFLAQLKAKIGNRKIDVVFDNANTQKKKKFYHSILQHKIELQDDTRSIG